MFIVRYVRSNGRSFTRSYDVDSIKQVTAMVKRTNEYKHLNSVAIDIYQINLDTLTPIETYGKMEPMEGQEALF